jgi:dolichyl-diphosphooligosaccharide--protein glycosyltransferase
LPAFFAPLAGVVAYLFTRRFTNEYGAFAAGVLTVAAPFYFMRTVPAWFDTDMFNVFFPLLVTWLFIEAVQSEDRRLRMLYSVLAAFSMLIFSMAWNGWQYQFYILIVFSVVYTVWRKLKGESVKDFLTIFGIFSILTLLLVGLVTGFLNVVKFFMGPIELIGLSSAQGPWAPWPDIYVSVSELGIPSFSEVVTGVGISFLVGIFGFFWILRVLLDKKLKEQFLSRMTWFFYLLLVSWTVVGFFSLTKGARFIILLIPPLVIISGIMVGLAVDYLSLLKKSERFRLFPRNKRFITLISLFIVMLMVVFTVFSAFETMNLLKPGANDDMWGVATWINLNTPNDTVIITDWSYGHLFSAVADRPVAFDGRIAYVETLPSRQFDKTYPYGSESPSTSRGYWIDKAFSTTNETLSYGIFRMIATSGDMGYITLDKYTKNTTKSVEILNNILGVNKKTAKLILMDEYGLNEEQAVNILQYTHPIHPRNFILVTSLNNLNRQSSIFKFGTWNFNKLKGANYTYSTSSFVLNGTILTSTNGIFMNVETGNITWKGKSPYSVILINNGTIKKQRINKSSEFSIVVLWDKNRTIVIDKTLENSMFMKLWVENSNSTYFKPIYRKGAVTVWQYA